MMSEHKPANIEALARAMYQRECDYVGSDHEGYCVAENIKTLRSFEAEIERLTKQRDAYQLKARLVEDRYLPCPDHRDKLTTDECMMCQIERLTADFNTCEKLLDERTAELYEGHEEISKLSAEIKILRYTLEAIALDTTNPTNQISRAAERARDALATVSTLQKPECEHWWEPTGLVSKDAEQQQCCRCHEKRIVRD